MAMEDRRPVENGPGSSGRQSSAQSAHINRNMLLFDFIRRDRGRWTTGQISLNELCTEDATSEMLVVFLPAEDELIAIGAHEHLSKRFKILPSFWRSLALEANGYFGCKSARAVDGALTFNTQFRFLIKEPTKKTIPLTDSTFSTNITYVWHKLGFFTSWLSSKNSVALCFDLPPLLKQSLSSSLTDPKNTIQLGDPFVFHSLLIPEVVVIYDAALWACRDVIRDLEKNRISSEDPQPDYIAMHEIARHVIHSSEVLAVAIETMTSIIQEHEIFFEENPSLPNLATMQSKDLRRNFRLQRNVFQGLHLRAGALEERLRNEINLAFNIVAQHDSRIAVRIAEATQVDSTAMKTISVLGLLFLPGTFICAVFSTSFFNFNPGSDTEPERWTVSEKFWVYWLVAIPVTAATVICWFVWQRVYLDKGLVGGRKR